MKCIYHSYMDCVKSGGSAGACDRCEFQRPLDGTASALRRFMEIQLADEDACAPDMVNHPPHYTGHPSGVECIELTEHLDFCLGNALKYCWRDKGKQVEDVKKAVWYLERASASGIPIRLFELPEGWWNRARSVLDREPIGTPLWLFLECWETHANPQADVVVGRLNKWLKENS